MAITSTAAFGNNPKQPTGFVNPTLPTIALPINGGYSVDIAQTRNASATTGATDMLTAIQADFNTTQAATLHLDATQTVTAALTVQTVEAINTGDDTSVYLTGTSIYRCLISYKYE